MIREGLRDLGDLGDARLFEGSLGIHSEGISKDFKRFTRQMSHAPPSPDQDPPGGGLGDRRGALHRLWHDGRGGTVGSEGGPVSGCWYKGGKTEMIFTP